MKIPNIGFVGLGNMGLPMATNLLDAGHPVCGFDLAGTKITLPQGIQRLDSIEQVTSTCDLILLSLPDGNAVLETAQAIVEASDAKVKIVADHSTIGIDAAEKSHELLQAKDIIYLDAPVSGGTSGAKSGTLALMVSGNQKAFEEIENILASMAQNRFFVGEAPGQAQAMKLLNNFLSATAMTATSEAIAFGARLGLNPRIMIDVLNSSSGQNTATRDKFPQRILTETYDAGFTIDLLNKDVELYLDEASRAGSSHTVAKTVGQVVSRIQEAMPGADFTKIYPFTASQRGD